jgi:hypothetical protein
MGDADFCLTQPWVSTHGYPKKETSLRDCLNVIGNYYKVRTVIRL